MRAALCAMAVLSATPGVAAADAPLDVWDGPFATLADATANDLAPATELPPFDDDQTLPADLPIDGLVALRREVVRNPAAEHMQYRLAAQTSAGWFMSGQLGVSQNRNRCYFTAVSGDASRFQIQYRCDVGRFDWASKEFLLLCGVDTTGRPACGRTLVSAQHNVHRGGKSDSATDVIYDTLHCGTKIVGDTVKLVPRKRPAAANCRGTTRFALRGPYKPGSHTPPPLFDESGRWLPDAS